VPKVFRLLEVDLRRAFLPAPVAPPPDDVAASTDEVRAPAPMTAAAVAARAVGRPTGRSPSATPSRMASAGVEPSASTASLNRSASSIAAARPADRVLVPGPAVPELEPVTGCKAPLLTEPLAWVIASALPDFKRPVADVDDAPWKQLFSAGAHGYSLRSFERRVLDYHGGSSSQRWAGKTLLYALSPCCNTMVGGKGR